MVEAVPSDAALVHRAREGDVEAFGQLVERHQDYMYNAVFHLVRREEDAEDVAQEVFVRAYENLTRFQGRAKFTTWLYGIMLNTVRSFWRRSSRHSVLSIDVPSDGQDGRPPEIESGVEDPADATMRREHVRMVRAGIARLDDQLREIIVLRDIQGLTYGDLADALDVPEGTVKSRLFRARRELRRVLEPYYDGVS